MLEPTGPLGFTAQMTLLQQQLVIRRIDHHDDLEDVYRLRYKAYREDGTIAERTDRRFADTYDALPNVGIFGLYHEDRLASSVRIHVLSATFPQSPAASIFTDILTPVLQRGGVVVDPTRLVADRDLGLAGLSYLTVRLGMAASEHFNADLGLATVRTEHRAFYRRTFFLDALSEPRTYPELARPIVMMGKPFVTASGPTYERYPFMRSTPEERIRLFAHYPIPDALERQRLAQAAA